MFYTLRPPYCTLQPVGLDELVAAPGETIVAIKAGNADEDIAPATRRVLRSAPFVTLCVWLENATPNRALTIALRASHLGVRGIIYGTADPLELRMQLADESQLHTDLISRLTLLGHELDDRSRRFLELVCHIAPQYRTVQRVLRDGGLDDASVYRSLAQARLGTPARIFRIVRATRIAMRLQRGDDLNEIVEQFNTGPASVNTLLSTVFGVEYDRIRTTLGWEYLLYCALDRQGMLLRE